MPAEFKCFSDNTMFPCSSTLFHQPGSRECRTAEHQRHASKGSNPHMQKGTTRECDQEIAMTLVESANSTIFLVCLDKSVGDSLIPRPTPDFSEMERKAIKILEV